MNRLIRIVLTVAALTWPAAAHAQFHVSPFAGVTFGGDASATGASGGVSAGYWIVDWLALEGEAAATPMFFKQDGFLINRSVTTFTGQVLVAPPMLASARLTPFVVVGLGALRPNLAEAGGLTTAKGRTLGLSVGAGAIAALHDRVGLRMDLRYLRGIGDSELDANPFGLTVSSDSEAAVQLAEAWLRLARVRTSGALLQDAERVLDVVIARTPGDYEARRTRALVYLGQHRFDDAVREAERCRALRGEAAWIDGVVGDAMLETGHLDAAIEAFDRMTARRPDAAAYARASCARELQGDIAGAVRLMRMADAATSAHDVEAQAWHAAHLGHLLIESDQPDAAAMQYARADLLFPGHPFVPLGLARVDLAQGNPSAALARLAPGLTESPTADAYVVAGDSYTQLGDDARAELHYRMAEAMWMSDTPDPGALARFRAARKRGPSVTARLP